MERQNSRRSFARVFRCQDCTQRTRPASTPADTCLLRSSSNRRCHFDFGIGPLSMLDMITGCCSTGNKLTDNHDIDSATIRSRHRMFLLDMVSSFYNTFALSHLDRVLCLCRRAFVCLADNYDLAGTGYNLMQTTSLHDHCIFLWCVM